MGKITSYAALTSPADADLLVAVDVDDTSMAATGTDKQLTLARLKGYAGGGYVASALAPGTGISANVVSDQSAAINAWILSLPAGTTAWFPAGSYYINHAVEVPRDIQVVGSTYGITPPYFVAMSGYADAQMIRNWQSTDTVNTSGALYAPKTTAWATTRGNNYVNISNLEFQTGGNSNITCAAFVGLAERTIIEHLTFSTNGNNTGTGLIGLALFANNDSGTDVDGRMLIGNITGYGQSWKHFFFFDGTNGGTNTGAGLLDIDIISFTSPANWVSPPVASDSPIYANYCKRLTFTGHQEMAPPNATSDVAAIRLLNCSDVHIYDYLYAPGAGNFPPFVKVTSDSSPASGISGQQVGPVLENISFQDSAGWFDRFDASCGITATSTTVTDTAILAADVYRPVYGPGIPSNTHITAVTAGVSFVMSNPAWRTGTVTLTISSNVIEDEAATGGLLPGNGTVRHFRYHRSLFAPRHLYLYGGNETRWEQYQSAPGAIIKSSHCLSGNDVALQFAPSSAVAESFPRRGATTAAAAVLATGTLHLTGVYMYPGDVVTSLSYFSGAAANTPSHWWFAFFDPDLNLVAISADQGSAAWGASTTQTLAMVTPYTTSVPGIHYAGILMVATTPVTLQAVTELGGSGPAAYGSSTGSLTTPASCPAVAGSITPVAGRPYVLVT